MLEAAASADALSNYSASSSCFDLPWSKPSLTFTAFPFFERLSAGLEPINLSGSLYAL
jgi:hypothetical protein